MMDNLTVLIAIAIIAISCLLLPKVSNLLHPRRREGRDSLAVGSDRSSVKTDKEHLRIEVTREEDFPEGWWTSTELFELERRAILGKAWRCVTHSSSFTKPGDYQSHNLAVGYPIILIKGKDGIIRAFHNVCRHRAYAVVTKESGSSLVLGCKYHGWSYDSQGRLIKAPKFENVEGFDKSANGLFEIPCRLDANGFIVVRLDTEMNEPAVDSLDRSMALSSRLDAWEVDGQFNWKLGESHDAFDIPTFERKRASSSLWSKVAATIGIQKAAAARAQPYNLTHVIACPSPTLWLVISVLPIDPTKSRVYCSIHGRPSEKLDSTLAESIRKDVVASVRNLEEIDAENRAGSTIVSRSVSSVQASILAKIKAHRKNERLVGKKIQPAVQGLELSSTCKVADNLCKELESAAGHGMSTLDW